MAFVDSDFNANGGDGGVEIFGGKIKSGMVTFDEASETFTTGFTLQNSQVVGNSDDGIELDGVTATDVTFKGDTIAENGRRRRVNYR